jgi:cytochrome P450
LSIVEQAKQRVLEPAVLRFYQWRGDPVAGFMRPETKIDPYPLYADLRRRGLVRSPLGAWATARHETATKVLTDRRFSASPTHQPGYRPPAYPAGDPRAELPSADLLTMDPPDHTRIRRLVASAFTPRAIADLEPWIRDLTQRLLAPLDAADSFDLIDKGAFPLPIAVISHLLGVPPEDQASFRAWGHEVAGTLEPHTSRDLEKEPRTAELELTAYLRELVRRRRADPDDSILSGLVAAEEEGDRLTLDEVVSTALLLLVAGFETTVNLLGNGTVALLDEPEQWQRLREEPELLPAAVEEMLRYESPVQLTSRTATEDVELDDSTIPRGEPIVVCLGGANRDPDVYPQPDHLDISRADPSPHLAFSRGIHHCLGATLARLEARIAFEQLTRRYPTLALAGTPIRRPLLVLRGYETVPVRAH